MIFISFATVYSSPVFGSLTLSPPPPLFLSVRPYPFKYTWHVSHLFYNESLPVFLDSSFMFTSKIYFLSSCYYKTNVSCVIMILIYNRYYTLAQYMNNPKICTPCLFTTNDFFFTIVWYCASMLDPSFRTCTFGGLFSTNNGC